MRRKCLILLMRRLGSTRSAPSKSMRSPLDGRGVADDRDGLGAPPAARRDAGALRCEFELRRGALLRVGALWSFAGWPSRQDADRVRAVVFRRRMSGCDRGLRRLYRRSRKLGNQIAARSDRPRTRHPGRRPQNDHAGSPSNRSCAGRPRLDSLRCARRRSSSLPPRAGRCSCHCSTSATSRRSKARSSRASASSSARTRRWPRNAPASATNCSIPPSRTSRNSSTHRATAIAAARRRQYRPQGRRRAAPSQGRQTLSNRDHRRCAELHAPSGRDRRGSRARWLLLASHHVPANALNAAGTVRAYKSLANVERVFRSLKTTTSTFGPSSIGDSAGTRCSSLLAYISMAHRQALAPMLFDDHDRAAGEALRPSPVAKALPPAARRKAKTKQPSRPAVPLPPLLADLVTLTRNLAKLAGAPVTVLFAKPTPIQQRAFDLLGVKPQMLSDLDKTFEVSQPLASPHGSSSA